MECFFFAATFLFKRYKYKTLLDEIESTALYFHYYFP